MSADQLRRAADAMRKEGGPFLEAVADLLDAVLVCTDGHPTSPAAQIGIPFGAFADVAESFLADPGDVPEVVL